MEKKMAIFIFVGVALAIIVSAILFYRQPNIKTATDSDEHQLIIGATIAPLHNIAQTIAGEQVKVIQILPVGASPHLFEPSPGVIKDLQNAKIIFAIGHGLDDWVMEIGKSLNQTSIKLVDNNIILKNNPHYLEPAAEDHDASADEHHVHDEYSPDPHYWLNPDNAIIIAQNIARQLAQLDPEQAAYFNNRVAEFTAEVNSNAVLWKESLKNLPQRDIITVHGGFNYFADYFDLQVAAAIEPFPGQEPTPAYLQAISEIVDRRQLTVLYTEPQLAAGTIKQLAKDLKLELLELDPLGGSRHTKTYIDLISYNVAQIARQAK